MDVCEANKLWGSMRDKVPFKATIPDDGGNGFCYVVDKDGNQVATFFSGETLHNATAVAAALNAVFTKAAPRDAVTDPDAFAGVHLP